MYAIVNIDEIDKAAVRDFQGFTSCLIYSTAHVEFRAQLLSHWKSFHEWSGKYLLVIAAELPGDTSVQADSSSAYEDGDCIRMMVSLPGLVPGSTDRANVDLQQHYGVRRSNMPCIVFFDKLRSPHTYVYSLRGTAPLVDTFAGIFDDCEKTWSQPNEHELSDLAAYRRRKMLELEPRLRGRAFLRVASGLVRNPAFGSVLESMGGALSYRP